ncbi:MAG: response regulator [Lachnospiraceae bacterium]|nr:response regulator [Lachnospiraceae bacterium]
MGITIYYIICTAISCLLLYSILSFIRQHNVLHILFFVFICIANFGYTFLAVSKSLDEALLANKISYIGAFLPFVMILSNAQFCRMKLPAWTVAVLCALNLVQLFFVNTIGVNDLYYREVKLGSYRGVSYLIKTYGPGHTYYIILLIFETLTALAVIFYALKKKKNTTYNTIIFLGVGVLFSVLVLIIERRISLEIDLVPLSYIINAFIYLHISYRTQVYGISAGIMNMYEEKTNYVCISLDENFRLMDYNKNAAVLFPEIPDIHIDTDDYPKEKDLYRLLVLWAKDIASKGLKEDEKTIPLGELIFRATVRERLSKKGSSTGYVIEMIDDTAFQKNLKIMERTMDDLDRARESAIRASHAKSDFMANMSHEIRTPINAITGMNEMIIREAKEKQILEYAGYISEAGSQLLSIVNDILDFEKIEAGKLDLSEGEYSLGRIIRSVYQMMHPKAEGKGVDFSIHADPHLPDGLFGDENRIRQILINIISNGIKYTPKGLVTMVVGGSMAGPDRVELRFEIRDTGIGIKEEDMERIFDSFERVDSRRNRSVEGTGLGLAISRELVTKMNGRIDASSVYGKGSTFTVLIPQTVTDKKEIGSWQRSEIVKEDGKERITINSPDMRILAVDDMPLNLIVIEKFLSMSRLKLDKATSAKQALKLIAANRYDVVLMDHFMPEMDGVEALQKIRAMGGRYETLPVIAVTANAITGSREEYISMGFQDYISKPVDYNTLVDILLRYCP